MNLVRDLGAALLLSAAAALAGCGSESVSSPETTGTRRADGGPADVERLTSDMADVEVVEVIDGDTIEVSVDGSRHRVRLVGIDAPERTTLRTGRTECGGDDATQALRAISDEQPKVTLRVDPTQDAVDRYGRVLAYVTAVGDSTTWQERMLTEGWARVSSLRRNPIERLDEFTAAAAQAEVRRAGVWTQCGGDFRRPE